MTSTSIRNKIKKVCDELTAGNEGANAGLTWSQEQIVKVCDGIKEMLLEKNRKYGDSALTPVRVFSHADPAEAIRVRIDDKLSRLCHEQDDEDEDVISDLIGYLVLLKVVMMRTPKAE